MMSLPLRLSVATAFALLVAIPESTVAIVIGERFAGAGDAGSVTNSSEKIVPPLQPKSHHAFFKHDYPHDHQPTEKHAFEYPYPVLQDSDEYAKDYVKDENNDDGYWKAQDTYDKLRTKHKERKAAIDAMGKKADEARKKAKAANDERSEAEKAR